MSKGITVKDVAREANVTAQTVSRVFRNQSNVSEKTRQRVLEAAAKCNYVPNQMAVSLRAGDTKRIAVVFDGLKNIYFSVMIDYLYRELEKRGYLLITVFRPHEYVLTADAYRYVLSMQACAVISFLEPEDGMGAVVRRHGVPCLVLGRRTDISELDYIVTDDVYGGRLAAERLISRGCKNFLYVAEGMGMTCVMDRFSGFESTLNKHGFTSRTIDAALGFVPELEKLKAEGFVPDGIFCFCDMLAFDVISELKSLGLDGVKVVGFDDIQSDITMPTRLTTVGVDKQKYIEFAVDNLLKRATDESSGRVKEKVQVFLKEGETA